MLGAAEKATVKPSMTDAASVNVEVQQTTNSTEEACPAVASSVVHAHLFEDEMLSGKKPESPMVLLESPSALPLDDSKKVETGLCVDEELDVSPPKTVQQSTLWNVKYTKFEENDLIMFIKDPQRKDVYNAFKHDNELPIYLDMESCKEAFCKAYGGSSEDPVQLPDLLFGNMVMFQKDMVATHNYNPFGLTNGDHFNTIIAEPVLSQKDIAAVKETERQIINGTTTLPSPEPPQSTFAADKVLVGSTNLFVVREEDGYDRGVYMMIRHDEDIPYFLSKESVAAMAQRDRMLPNYFLARCVEIEHCVAGHNDEWVHINGREYGIVTAEVIPHS